MTIYEKLPDYSIDTDFRSYLPLLVTWFLNRVMEEEASEQTRCLRYERTPARRARRNGYKPRTLKTTYGELHLLKPQLRKIPFEKNLYLSGKCIFRCCSTARIGSPISRASTVTQIKRSVYGSETGPLRRRTGGTAISRRTPSMQRYFPESFCATSHASSDCFDLRVR